MNEKNNAFSEITSDNKSKKDKSLTKLFTVELLIYSYIYEIKSNKKIYTKTEEQNEFIDKEKIMLDIPIIPINYQTNSINEFFIWVDDLKHLLKIKGYPITTSTIYIYDEDFIEGYSLVNDKEKIYSVTIKNDTIKLKLKNYIDNKLIEDTFSILKKCFSDSSQEKAELGPENSSISNQEKNKELNKRTRTIGEVVKIVYAQRKFFNGYYNDEGENIKFNLDAASKKVNIKRKTLDDYLKQLRKGREKGFDFNKNKNKPISNLRRFNEENKNKNVNLDKNINEIDNIDEIDDKKENLLELEEVSI